MNPFIEETSWVDQRLRELYYGYYKDEELGLVMDTIQQHEVDTSEQIIAITEEERGEHEWVDQRLRELYYGYYKDEDCETNIPENNAEIETLTDTINQSCVVHPILSNEDITDQILENLAKYDYHYNLHEEV